MLNHLLPVTGRYGSPLFIGLLAALLAVVTPDALYAQSYSQQAKSTAVEILDESAAQAVQQALTENLPVVLLQTSLGNLYVELYPDKAPESVKNFLTYVDDGFYDGTVFHRVIEGFMIQTGGVDLRLNIKETRAAVVNEADNGLLNEKFTVAMARTADPHSATSQFFINTADNHFLDHKEKTPTGWGYTVVGRLIAGERIAEWISKAPTGPAGPFTSDVPNTPVVVNKARRLD